MVVVLLMVTANPLFGADKGGIYIDADMQYGYAQQCFDSGDPSSALVELKRFIHFFPEDTRVRQALFLTGKAYYATRQYENAQKTFDAFLFPFSQDPLVIEAYFMAARTYEQRGHDGQAETTLQNLILLTDSIPTKDRAHAALGWMGLKQSRDLAPLALEKAETHINSLSHSGALTYNQDRLNKTISAIKGSKKKSPTIAGVAAIFPGMGFFYCERYQDALVSFILNTALIMAAHTSFERGNPALGGVISFVEAGFYAGNIYGSISSAHKHNRFQNQQALEGLEQDLDPPL